MMKTTKKLTVAALMLLFANVSFGQWTNLSVARLSVTNSTQKLGIGTSWPQERLDIYGSGDNIQLRNYSETEAGIIMKDHDNQTTEFGKIFWNSGGQNEFDFYINDATTPKMTLNKDAHLTINGAPTAKLNVLTANNTDYAALIQNGGGSGQGLYIKGGVSGSSQPEYALLRVANYNGDDIMMVEGAKKRVYAREILVNMNTWPDYVFKSEYELKSLDEVEAFIEENSHLPGVPSEEVIVNGGVNLGQMDAILLEKIEELTLYTIKQQKIIDDLKNEMDELKAKE